MATFLVAFLLNVRVLPAASPQQADKRTEQLQKEREKLKREKDPVDHTKIQIKISEILLTFVADAIKNENSEELQKQLDEYCRTIQDGLQTMMNTGRDANKHPAGFKDLEIALRRQGLRLDSLGQALTYDQREPVLKAKAAASAIHDRLIKALLIEDIHAQSGK